METIIVAVLLVLIICGISVYLIRAKKRGKKCVGCPYANGCQGKCNGGSSCSKADRRSEE